MERVYFVEGPNGLQRPPVPLPNVFKNRCADFRRSLISVLPRIRPLTNDQFIARYQGRKKVRYERCAADSRPLKIKDSFTSMFVKGEKLCLSSKPDPACRAIQPRGYKYNLELGKLIGHLEKPLYKSINKVFGGPTVFKGYNSVDSGRLLREAWDEFKNPVAIGLDASRFDQHVSVQALEFEHEIWEHMIPGARDRAKLRKLFKWQRHNKGFARAADGVAKYSVDGTRASGDMNTASGNCMLMCAMVKAFMGGIKFRLINNGDDCVIIVELSDLPHLLSLPDYFLEFGFKMKVESPVVDFEKIEFCQTKPVWCFDHYRMVRIPQMAMSKDLTANYDLSDGALRSTWYDAVRCGGLALTDGCPVWGDFYRMYPAYSGRKVKLDNFEETGMIRHMLGDIKYANLPITPQSRYSFWLAFGILPDTQLELESVFATKDLCKSRVEGSHEIVECAYFPGPHGYTTRISKYHGKPEYSLR